VVDNTRLPRNIQNFLIGDLFVDFFANHHCTKDFIVRQCPWSVGQALDFGITPIWITFVGTAQYNHNYSRLKLPELILKAGLNLHTLAENNYLCGTFPGMRYDALRTALVLMQ
jgi:hypothetical protein